MSTRSRIGLNAFLSRRAPPPREQVSELRLGDRVLPLRVRRHASSRRMTLRLSADGREARVTVPEWVPLREGEAFAQSRVAWIAAQLAALPVQHELTDGSTLPYRGESRVVRWDAASPRKPQPQAGALHCGGPEAGLTARIRRWLEEEALVHMQADLLHFCAAAQQPAPPLRLSRAQRRWGSCSSDGTIRMNWRLIMAPDAVRRSVVAHEVAHLVHFDHSPAFHALHARVFDGDVPAADKWLKKHGRSLYAPFG